MFMYSNGPVSTRCACTVPVCASAVRSETQLQTWPSSSGCMVSRNRTVESCWLSTSVAAYSLNNCGHDGTSLVMAQTRSSGALMTIELSVCAAISGSRLQQVIDVGDGDGGGRAGFHRVVAEPDAELPLDLGLDLQDGE